MCAEEKITYIKNYKFYRKTEVKVKLWRRKCQNGAFMQLNYTKNIRTYLYLHLLLLLYSLGGIFTKEAGRYEFLSWKFITCYAGLMLILGIYAIGWQQIIKKLPLTTAFANKAVVIIWGIVWGILFFHEKISIGKLVGASIVMVGVILYTLADEGKNEQ